MSIDPNIVEELFELRPPAETKPRVVSCERFNSVKYFCTFEGFPYAVIVQKATQNETYFISDLYRGD